MYPQTYSLPSQQTSYTNFWCHNFHVYFKNTIELYPVVLESAKKRPTFGVIKIKKMTPWSIFEKPLHENKRRYQLCLTEQAKWHLYGVVVHPGLKASDDVISSHFEFQQDFFYALWELPEIFKKFNKDLGSWCNFWHLRGRNLLTHLCI